MPVVSTNRYLGILPLIIPALKTDPILAAKMAGIVMRAPIVLYIGNCRARVLRKAEEIREDLSKGVENLYIMKIGVVNMTQEKDNGMIPKQQMGAIIEGYFKGFMEEEKRKKVRIFSMLNKHAKKGQILFAGSSLMEQFPINEMQLKLDIDRIIYNRGIGGTTTTELLDTMNECIFDLEPSKMFINIGSNDIGSVGPGGYKKENLILNYNKIMDQIKERLPQCEVYVMAYYPINAKGDFGLDKAYQDSLFATRTNANILKANEAVEELTRKHGFNFINVNEGLTDEEGNLKAEFSIEGLHMWPNAYYVVLENLKKYL